MPRHRLLFLVALLWCLPAFAQQPQSQTLTFYYGYAVKPGQEEAFANLVKTVGAPVRDKLMSEGVINAWGVEQPVLRSPGGITHLIWFNVNNWGAVDQVLAAMAAQIARLDAEAAAPAARGQKPLLTIAQRATEIYDGTKTRDWLIRDLVFVSTPRPVAATTLPITRSNFLKIKPGKAAEYRALWDRYNKPVYDALVADGTLLAYGLAAEEIKTDGDWTHFVWMATADMASLEKVRFAFVADRDRRSVEERNSITAAFTSVTEPDANRAIVTRSTVFKTRTQ
jgi:hypothetical protein